MKWLLGLMLSWKVLQPQTRKVYFLKNKMPSTSSLDSLKQELLRVQPFFSNLEARDTCFPTGSKCRHQGNPPPKARSIYMSQPREQSKLRPYSIPIASPPSSIIMIRVLTKAQREDYKGTNTDLDFPSPPSSSGCRLAPGPDHL